MQAKKSWAPWFVNYVERKRDRQNHADWVEIIRRTQNIAPLDTPFMRAVNWQREIG